MTEPRAITGWRVLAIALPVVLSNATIPLQGAVDTAIIGNIGTRDSLGGVGLGAELITLMVGVFNFLQLGVSGLSAQALGAGDHRRVLNTLLRALVIGMTIAAALLVFQSPLRALGLSIFESGPGIKSEAGRYFSIVIWAAPFTLANMALTGWFAGQEMTGRLFRMQLVTTLSNISLSLLLGGWFGLGLVGVASATVIAQALGVSYGLWLARARAAVIAPAGWRVDLPRVLRRDELLSVMRVNADIFIRTLVLMLSFAWFMRLGSQQGDTLLAANVILWQFFVMSAYALDGFAISAETLVGQAKGAGNRGRLRQAAVISTLWSGGLALMFSGVFWLASSALIELLTDIETVRAAAKQYALWAALIPAAGFAAFQLDGIFIGATASRAMRNAMLLTALVFFPLSTWLASTYGNHGVWAGAHAFLILRALALLLAYPSLERAIAK